MTFFQFTLNATLVTPEGTFHEMICPKDTTVLERCVKSGIEHFGFDNYMKEMLLDSLGVTS
jgi:hypothetical protein